MSKDGMPEWRSEQQAYDAGYDEQGRFPKKNWFHVVDYNAYMCGGADYQNQCPKNKNYDRNDYHQDTFERKQQSGVVSGLTEQERNLTK
jgi:hypothetical protein